MTKGYVSTPIAPSILEHSFMKSARIVTVGGTAVLSEDCSEATPCRTPRDWEAQVSFHVSWLARSPQLVAADDAHCSARERGQWRRTSQAGKHLRRSYDVSGGVPRERNRTAALRMSIHPSRVEPSRWTHARTPRGETDHEPS